MKFAPLSNNSRTILENRYLLRDNEGVLAETPDELFRRVAGNIASINGTVERTSIVKNIEDQFFKAMRGLEFIPNSPTLMNAGTELQQLSACFVLPVGDSIESIYDAVKWSAIIHQSGGGTGFSFSDLRPSGDTVRSTGGVASGPVSFMKVFDAATEAVKQGGRRRGASMGILRVDHPDVSEFIHAKDDLKSLSNFNISVAVTDDFMEKASRGDEYELVNPRSGVITGTKNAAEVLEDIAESAWRTGDPGLIFIDEVNRRNPAPLLGQIKATNPCGEVPLLPFEACVLGSINLNRMAERGEMDWERLDEITRIGVRFLDGAIDASRFPLVQTEDVVKANRKIGLGVMGFADCLIRLGVVYGSRESLEMARKVIRRVADSARRESASIAEEKASFPNISMSKIPPPQRNLTLLSIAPTGTISMIAGCSSGIEPLYAISYTKHVLNGEHFREVNPLFMEVCRKTGIFSQELMRKVSKRHSIQGMREIPEDIRELFVTTQDIPPEAQVKMQAVFQDVVDNAVSKTINLPSSVTEDEISEIFHLAHDMGCKGITVYREGSKPGQVLTVEEHATCPICGSPIRGEEGGFTCRSCGHIL
ncbi:MAG TPA: adenosylcobalamin-dependent ribonucleoside-diphosphate reductase [Methanomassiliicoccales archaeon]|nr:adenosylcobalamin-dependent ribonucleoside-diphosphate reductase [Methanomassiliicoccales archaeon]